MARNHPLTQIWHSEAVSTIRHAASPRRIQRYLSARRRRLPDYIVAGAQKAGTTSLWAYLSEHPDVEPPITKEVHFFDSNFQRGINWYRMHFPLAPVEHERDSDGPRRLTGEATPYYMFHPLVPRRIAEAVPDAKVILLLRNPVDRAYSHYKLKRKRGQEPLSFEEAIDAEEERLRGEHERIVADPTYDSQPHHLYSYTARGRYADQIPAWQRCFAPEQLLIVESGELFEQTANVFQRVLDFLGLRRWQPEQFRNHYPGGYRDRMEESTRRRLIDYFAPHNARLNALLGTQFDWDR